MAANAVVLVRSLMRAEANGQCSARVLKRSGYGNPE